MRRLIAGSLLTFLTTTLLIQPAELLAQQRAGVPGVETLQPGAAVVRTMTRGQTHRFNVSLQGEEFVQVVVDQRGIDVLVRVLPPDGKNIQEFDSPNGTAGPELVPIVSVAPGLYAVEVSPLNPNQEVSGQFEIRVGSARRATPPELQIAKRSDALKARAIAVLTGLNQALQDIHSVQTKVRAQLQAAGLFRTIDENAARRLVVDAQAGLQLAIDKLRSEGLTDFSRYDAIMQMRQEGAQLIGNFDPELALNFIRSTNPGIPNIQYPGQADQELVMETNLATQIANKDAGRAVQIAEEVLSRGYFAGLTNVVSALRPTNPALAARVARGATSKLLDEKLIATPEAANLAGNLLRLPRTQPQRPRSDGAVPLLDLPPLSEQDFRNLFSKTLSEALAFQPSLESPYSYEMNAARSMLNTLKSMPADVHALGPTAMPMIEEKLRQLEAPSNSRDRFSQDLNSMPVDLALQSISLAPSDMRDSLYQQLAQRVAREGDIARGRQILTDGIANPRQRQNAMANLERQATFEAMQAGRYDEVLRTLTAMTVPRERATMAGSVASSVNRVHKKEAVLGFLEQVRALMGPSAQAPDGDHMNALLQIAMGFARQGSSRGFEIIEPLIHQLNDLALAAIPMNGFGHQYYQDGELMLQNGNPIGSAANQMAQALGALSLIDFDRARQDLEKFRRPEIRVAGYLSIAQQSLNPPPLRR